MNAALTNEPDTITLESLEATLPQAVEPIGSYVTAVQVGDLLYTSGALPVKEGQVVYHGAVGSFIVSTQEGQEAARLCLMNLLAVIKAKLGSLHRVQQVVKLTGYVNSVSVFTEHAQVVNGASDLLLQVFGERGKHARTSIGVSSLPRNASVEIDLIVQVLPA